MTERPIIFSAPMVRAILENRKTQTRRIVKQAHKDGVACSVHPARESGWIAWHGGPVSEEATKEAYKAGFECPYGVPGDRLWVRESMTRPDGDPWLYAADRRPVMVSREDETAMLVWAHHKEQGHCPSIHMPRWAARITLEITDVRVQRVQEITEEDAKAEGTEEPSLCDLGGMLKQAAWSERQVFQRLWDHINAKRGYGWSTNPFVWAITFRRLA